MNDNLLLLFQGAKLHNATKGEVLHATDQAPKLSYVAAGYIKRYFIAHDGNLGVQVIYGPGDIFPLTAVFKVLFDQDTYFGPETYYYQPMAQASIYTISADELRHRVQVQPELCSVLLQAAGKRLTSNIHFLENLRLHGSYCKTAHQLAYFAQRFGKNVRSGIKIQLPLTHQDIADIIGTTRETVTAGIIKLRDQKIIETSRHIIIKDYKKLVTEAYS